MEIFETLKFASRGWTIILPLSMMLIDYITGLLNAWSKGEVKSSKMRQGLIKKFGEILILVMGELFSYSFRFPEYIISAISLYIIIMELISVFENLENMGIPIPKFIRKALDEAKEEMEKEDIKIYESSKSKKEDDKVAK